MLGIDVSVLVSDAPEQPSAGCEEVSNKRTVPWGKLLFAALVILCVVFFSLWQAECNREAKLELLCGVSADSCLESLRSYEETGKQMHYISAVSGFRAFMQAYHLLTEDTGKHGNYTYLNEVYGCMLCARDEIDTNLSVLIKAMGALSRDIHDYSGHNLMYDLYIALLHG